MNQTIKTLLIGILFSVEMAQAQVTTPLPCGPVPTENQLKWQDMEMYAFIHYSMNTYTDQEWGFGNEDLKLFNPADLDCRQWARVCKQAGMRGVIFTAKHHCGFFHRFYEGFHLFKGVVERKRSTNRSRNPEAGHYRFGTMVTCADGYPHLVDDGAEVVRMHTFYNK